MTAMEIRPSQCSVTGRDTVDCIIEALSEICSRPHWLLLSGFIPFLGTLSLALVAEFPFFHALEASIFGVIFLSSLKTVILIPCVLAWCRVGFFTAKVSPKPGLCETRGLFKALDLILMLVAAVAFVAVGLYAVLAAMTETGRSIFPASGVFFFSGALVLIPVLILGGVRLIISVPAGAIGWDLSYAAALVLTRHRGGWLAGLGMAFLCLFPLSTQSVIGLKGLLVSNAAYYDLAIPDEVWRWLTFVLTTLLCAVVGHGLGQILRRLLDGMPDNDEDAETPEVMS